MQSGSVISVSCKHPFSSLDINHDCDDGYKIITCNRDLNKLIHGLKFKKVPQQRNVHNIARRIYKATNTCAVQQNDRDVTIYINETDHKVTICGTRTNEVFSSNINGFSNEILRQVLPRHYSVNSDNSIINTIRVIRPGRDTLLLDVNADREIYSASAFGVLPFAVPIDVEIMFNDGYFDYTGKPRIAAIELILKVLSESRSWDEMLNSLQAASFEYRLSRYRPKT